MPAMNHPSPSACSARPAHRRRTARHARKPGRSPGLNHDARVSSRRFLIPCTTSEDRQGHLTTVRGVQLGLAQPRRNYGRDDGCGSLSLVCRRAGQVETIHPGHVGEDGCDTGYVDSSHAAIRTLQERSSTRLCLYASPPPRACVETGGKRNGRFGRQFRY